MSASNEIRSLAEFLGTSEPTLDKPEPTRLEDIADGQEFAKAVLNSIEFRRYIVNSLLLGEIPAAVLLRVMDLAGPTWQQPPKRLQHVGEGGGPIVTEVRRVIVHVHDSLDEDDAADRVVRKLIETTH